MSWLERRRPAKKFSGRDSRVLLQNLVRWDQPLRDALERMPSDSQATLFIVDEAPLVVHTERRLCWSDARKLCIHGVRLDHECTSCVAAADQKAGYAAYDGVSTEWREVRR